MTIPRPTLSSRTTRGSVAIPMGETLLAFIELLPTGLLHYVRNDIFHLVMVSLSNHNKPFDELRVTGVKPS